MSRAWSASTGRSYGRARVLKAWGLPRSTFYERRRPPLCLRPPARRGRKPPYSDEDLQAQIRRTIQESPFHEEGHRKAWARLRVGEVRRSMRSVPRLERENALLALHRQPKCVGPKYHDSTILAQRPTQIWGIDAAVRLTLDEVQAALSPVAHRGTVGCAGIQVARYFTECEVFKPTRKTLSEKPASFGENINSGIRLRRHRRKTAHELKLKESNHYRPTEGGEGLHQVHPSCHPETVALGETPGDAALPGRHSRNSSRAEQGHLQSHRPQAIFSPADCEQPFRHFSKLRNTVYEQPRAATA